MSGFVPGQPVVWGDLPFIVTATDNGAVSAVAPLDSSAVAFTGDEADVNEVQCAWFTLCDHTATRLQRHPVLGLVPICDRCTERLH